MEWVKEFLNNNLIGLITAVSAVAALIVERRKRLAEQKRSEADALKGMQEVYDKFVADYDVKLDNMRKELLSLQTQLQAANEKIKEFELQAVKDKKEIASLRRKIEQYETELKSYKKSIGNEK